MLRETEKLEYLFETRTQLTYTLKLDCSDPNLEKTKLRL